MPKLIRASSPWSTEGVEGTPSPLPPQLVNTAVARLCWIAVTCAVTTVVWVIVQNLLQPDLRALRDPYFPLTVLFVLFSSLAVTAINRFRLLSPIQILNVGLWFEVFIAFFIAHAETAIQMPLNTPILGASLVCTWICFVVLLVPRKPFTTLVTALACAAMWPAAYFINLGIHHYTMLPWNRLAAWIYPPFTVAVLAAILSKRIFRIELAAEKARELGAYSLVQLIGRGGMGEVWRARHRLLARDAAVKLIRAELMIAQSGGQSDITRKRFEREASAISSLHCPHTVQLFDFGVAQDGSFYYVMELLDGISLGVLVERFGPQPESRVVHILRQVCKSLDEAHHRNLIHRDIKPTNIFICRMGLEYDYAKVLDFGLVKDIGRDHGAQLTMDGASAGTPAFMAPEVALGEHEVDGRVDLYAGGCLAYYLLTGAMVFDESTPTATALAHVQKAPIPPSRRSELPISSEMEAVVLSCLAKNPADRPATAGDLNRMLSKCGSVTEWNQEKAREWWESYLPESSEYRTGRQLPREGLTLTREE